MSTIFNVPQSMIYGLLLAVLAALLWSTTGVLCSKVSKEKISLLAFFAVTSFFGTVMSLMTVRWSVLEVGELGNLSLLLLVMAIAGILSNSGTFLMIRGMKTGHSAATWTIGQSALILPAMFAVFYWKEHFKLVQYVGLTMIVFGIYFLANRREKSQRKDGALTDKWIVNSIGCFMFFGLCQILLLVPSHWESISGAADLRVPFIMGPSTIILAVLCLIFRKGISKACLKMALPFSICAVAGQRSFFAAADMLTQNDLSSITFPIAIGGSVLGVSVYSHFVAKERFSLTGWGGIALALTGIALISLVKV